MHKFLNDQIRTIERSMEQLQKIYPPTQTTSSLLSMEESSWVLMSLHFSDLARHFRNAVEYVERMLRNQLIAAIGKSIELSDIDQFLRYHNARLLTTPPTAFCHAIPTSWT